MANYGITKENGALYDVRNISDFRDLINQSARLYRDEPAFRLRDKAGEAYHDISYHQFREDIRAFGTGLYAMGLQGQKVAVMGNNSYQWALTYLAVTSGIGVIVPIDKELLFDDVNRILTVSDARVLVADARALKKLKERRNELPGSLRIICMDPVPKGEDYIPFRDVFENGEHLREENANAYRYYMTEKIDPEAMSVLIFTSGTSDLAKGVILSQKNICFTVMSNSSVAKTGPEDRMLSILPMHHTFECTLGFLLPLYNGCVISFNDSLLHLAKNMQDFKPTVIFTVPLLVEKFHDKIEKAAASQKHGLFKLRFGRKLSMAAGKFGVSISDKIFTEIIKTFGGCLRLFIVGAASMDAKVVEDFKAYGITTYLGYGLTECSPLVSCNHDGLFTTNTVGTPIPGVQVKIVEPGKDGNGEVMVKGPNVMLGYYLNEELTKATITEDGWIHTGDLGRFNEDHHLILSGRAKNMILTKNGENVYPEEIETLLNKNPYIAESMVLAKDVEGKGTVVAAKIFPDYKAIAENLKKTVEPTYEEVRKFIQGIVDEVNKVLPKYKNVLDFDIRENEFIKTTTSKIKRYANLDDDKKKEKQSEEARDTTDQTEESVAPEPTAKEAEPMTDAGTAPEKPVQEDSSLPDAEKQKKQQHKKEGKEKKRKEE